MSRRDDLAITRMMVIGLGPDPGSVLAVRFAESPRLTRLPLVHAARAKEKALA